MVRIPAHDRRRGTGGLFYLDVEGREADAIENDLALRIRKKDGVIACVSCSHAGIVNTLTHIRRLTNRYSISAVIDRM